MLLKLWNLISEDISILCQMGQSTASLLVSLSLYIMVLSSNQKGECWQKKKKKKAQDNLSPIFTLCRFRSLKGDSHCFWAEEEDYLLKEGQDLRKYIIFVCIYMCTHTYINIISGWNGVPFTFWSGEYQPQFFHKMLMFPAARKQFSPSCTHSWS